MGAGAAVPSRQQVAEAWADAELLLGSCSPSVSCFQVVSVVTSADLLAHLLHLVSTYPVCKPRLLFRNFINQNMSLLGSMPPVWVMVKEMVWWCGGWDLKRSCMVCLGLLSSGQHVRQWISPNPVECFKGRTTVICSRINQVKIPLNTSPQ